MKILISGAGIGGLSAALCLLKSGHDVTVLEQSASLSEVGAGLQCGANAMHVLRYLGLEDALRPLAVEPQRVEFRDFKTGRRLHRLQLGQAYAEKYGAPYLHLHRADLQAVLLNELQRISPASLVLGCRVRQFEEAATQVSISTDSGTTFAADLLIAADGIHSKVRQLLFSDNAVQRSDSIAWRVVVPREAVPEYPADKLAYNFVGPNKHCVIYYLRDQKLLNLVGVVETETRMSGNDASQTNWLTHGSKDELMADFSGWHPLVTKLLSAVDGGDCYRWALAHSAPLSNWSSPRVTLLGDAAHATLPFMASGAAMAIEDARILDRALSQAARHSTQSAQIINNALQLYQRNRMPRTARIQTDSARVGQLYHLKSGLARRAAFAGLGIFGGAREEFLPNYNANSVELT